MIKKIKSFVIQFWILLALLAGILAAPLVARAVCAVNAGCTGITHVGNGSLIYGSSTDQSLNVLATATPGSVLVSGANGIPQFQATSTLGLLSAIVGSANINVTVGSTSTQISTVNSPTFSGNLVVSGTLQAATTTLSNLASGTFCLHSVNGVISTASSDCFGGAGTLSGGSYGKAAIWNGTTSVTSDMIIDDLAGHSGVNASSSTVSFNVQGSGALNPFNVASSSGVSVLTVNNLSQILVNGTIVGPTSSPLTFQAGGGTSASSTGPSAFDFLNSSASVIGYLDTNLNTLNSSSSPTGNYNPDKYATILGTYTSSNNAIKVSSTSTMAVGDKILVIQMVGTGQGNFEEHKITAISGATVTLDSLLTNTYTYTASTSLAQIVDFPAYTNYTVVANSTLIPPVYSTTTGTGGVMYINVYNTFTNNGTTTADGVGFGPTIGNGAGGTYGGAGYAAAGGNGGSGSGAGSTYGNAQLSANHLIMGSGGGNGDGGELGGNGGGIVYISANTVVNSNWISAGGQGAQATGVGNGNASGGGSGGAVLVRAKTVTVGSIASSGGGGGGGNFSNGYTAGGNGYENAGGNGGNDNHAGGIGATGGGGAGGGGAGNGASAPTIPGGGVGGNGANASGFNGGGGGGAGRVECDNSGGNCSGGTVYPSIGSSSSYSYPFVFLSGVANFYFTNELFLGPHIGFSQVTAPTVSSCGTGSPTVTGTDNAGSIQTGGGATTACTLNFTTAWLNPPVCLAEANTQVNPYISAVSKTSVTFSYTSVTSDILYYHCFDQTNNN